MPLFELQTDKLEKISETTFASEAIKERYDLQRLLRSQIEIVSPDTLIIAEEYGSFEGSRRSIDLLGIDKSGDLVVIELKRTNDGGHMDLQSLRYAAMVSNMTFAQAVETYNDHLSGDESFDDDAEARILEFLDWEETDKDSFGSNVRIVLVSAEFSKEITTTAMWLSSQGIDIRCVRLKPHRLAQNIIIDVQQIFPLPEANDYLIKIREKNLEERTSREQKKDFTRYDVTLGDSTLIGLSKRSAIYKTCRYLCENGVTPEEITRHLPRTFARLWIKVEGIQTRNGFLGKAAEQAETKGKNFDPSRWYSLENELIFSNGNTYAFVNQWGGPKWAKSMTALADNYPNLRIRFQPTKLSNDPVARTD